MKEKKRRSAFSAGTKGAAMVELTFVIPILLFVGFGTLEFTRAFRAGETLSSLALESAKAGYKRCRTLRDDDLNTCLSNVYAEIQSFANLAQPGAEIILSAYLYDPATLSVSLVSRSGVVAGVDDSQPGPPQFVEWTPRGHHKTRHTEAAIESSVLFNGVGNPPSLSARSPVLVVGEAFFSQEVVSPAPFLWSSRAIELYETSMF